MKSVDLAFIGLGAAAMSLATRLADAGHSASAVFIEPDADPGDDRTWCGWGPNDHPFSERVTRRWYGWAVSADGETVITGRPDIPYEMLRASEVRAHAHAAIAQREDWAILAGRAMVEAHRQTDGWVLVLDNGETVQARWVLDARPPALTLHRPWVWQSFVGLELSGHDFGEDHIVRLMDFVNDDAPLATFVYELPIARDRRLVELTRFTPAPANLEHLRDQLDGLLAERGWDRAHIERVEQSHLPMAAIPPDAHDQWIRIGTAGGSMRPATGYAFHAIQAWADQCAAAMRQGGEPIPPRRAALLDWLDGVFLESLWQAPDVAGQRFTRLFQRTPPAALTRFLMARASALDILQVLRALPMRPMLKAAFRRGWRRT